MSPFTSSHGRGGRHGHHGQGHGHPGAEGDGPGRGRRGRMFDQGQLKLLVLHVLDAQPSHGYEVIRAIADLAGGDYSPSPGTVYPTLTWLEDMGLAEALAEDGGRRQYRITSEGRVQLQSRREHLDALLLRLREGRRHALARRAPEIERAMENLKTALRLRFTDGTPDTEALQRIADAIDRAAVEIGRDTGGRAHAVSEATP